MHSENNDSFTSFPIRIPFISFFCLVALTRISNTMLSSSGESVYPHHKPDLRRKDFLFLIIECVLANGLAYMTYIYKCSLLC